MIVRISILWPIRSTLRLGKRVGQITALVLVAALLLLLGGQWGWGPADGSGSPGASSPQAELAPAPRTPTAELPTEDADIVGGAVVPAVLDVWVEEHEYVLADPAGGGRRKADVDEIVELAARTAGDADGVRVRIRRMPSARVTAWMRLYEALIEAGLPEAAVRLTDATGQP